MGKSKKKRQSEKLEKVEQEEKEDPESEKEETYQVEVIEKARVDDDADGWEYYVKWARYPRSENSWEPSANLSQCQRLLSSFWKHVDAGGDPNQDHFPGEIVQADKLWIAKERKFFKDNIGVVQSEDDEVATVPRTKKHRVGPPKTEPKAEASTSSKKGKGKAPEVSDSEDDTPLAKLPLKKADPIQKRKRTVVFSDDGSQASSESDIPLNTVRQPRKKVQKTISAKDVSNKPTLKPRDSLPSQAKGKQKAIETPVRSSSPSNASLFSGSPSPQSAKDKTQLSVSIASGSKTTSTSAVQQEPIATPASASSTGFPGRPKPTKTNSTANVTKKKTPTIPPKLFIKPEARGKVHVPPKDVSASGSGLSTKQRLAQNALAPVLPKTVPGNSSDPKASQALNKSHSSLGNLPSFKRKPAAPAVSANEVKTPVIHPQEDVTMSAFNSAPSPSHSHDAHMEDIFDTVVDPPSPNDYTDVPMNDTSFFESFPGSSRSPILHAEPPAPVNPTMKAVDDFLAQIMPGPLAAPLEQPTETDIEPVMPPKRLIGKVMPPSKTAPAWKWSGKINIQSGGNPKTLEHGVVKSITDVVHEGMPFRIAMGTMEGLHFRSFHHLADLDGILSACKPVQQLASVTCEGEEDQEILQKFANYMNKKRLVTLVAVEMDGHTTAHIILFPPQMHALMTAFQVPPEPRNQGALIAGLFPYKKQQAKQWQAPYVPLASAGSLARIDNKDSLTRTIKSNPAIALAVRILQYPDWLHEYMASSTLDRPYCIWAEGGDLTTRKEGLETTFLRSILQTCPRAQDVGHKAATKAIFIHIGSFKTLWKFGGFMERRRVETNIMFVTYGTHEDIHPSRWGMREVFPIGGVVTFTASALVEDPLAIYDRVIQIAEHPLWGGYILPSVLGMAVKILYRGEDPLAVFDRGAFAFHFLLTAIHEGKIALLRAPPKPLKSSENRQAADWVEEQMSSLTRDPRAILELCVNEFHSQYNGTSESQYADSLSRQICSDLALMQAEPAIMEKYRRFVVLKATHDNTLVYHYEFEWVTAAAFSFRDDFYKPEAKS